MRVADYSGGTFRKRMGNSQPNQSGITLLRLRRECPVNVAFWPNSAIILASHPSRLPPQPTHQPGTDLRPGFLASGPHRFDLYNDFDESE